MKTKYVVLMIILMIIIMIGLIVFQVDKRVDIMFNGLDFLRAGQ